MGHVNGHSTTNEGAKPDARSRALPLPDRARIVAAKLRMIENDTDAAKWARENGESYAVVLKVLSGKRPCVKGASLRVAIKLAIVDRPAPVIRTMVNRSPRQHFADAAE